MSSAEVETFEVTHEVPLVDADEVPIKEGSVLRNLNDGVTGVVVLIVRDGTLADQFAMIGDIQIQIGAGHRRCTNNYQQWRHVPREEQTYSQRLLSWQIDGYDHYEDEPFSNDTGRAISGLLALLPADPVDWEGGDWPTSVDDALRLMVEFLEGEIANKVLLAALREIVERSIPSPPRSLHIENIKIIASEALKKVGETEVDT